MPIRHAQANGDVIDIATALVARSLVPVSSNMDRGANPACVAEYPQITFDFGQITGGFFRVVRKFYRRPAVDRRHLADDRDRIEIDRAVWRTSHEIIGQVGAPAETDPHPAGEMVVDILDRSDIHG